MFKIFKKDQQTTPPPTTSSGDGEQLRLLIVDSDASFQKKLESILRKAEVPNDVSSGFDLTPAYSLRDAIDTIENECFDIILTDINLSDATGFLVLEEIIEHGNGTPILVLSNLTNWSMILKSAQSGISDFLLKKALDPDLLLRSVFYSVERNKVERRAKRAEDIYQSLVKILPVGLFRAEKSGSFTYGNSVFAEMMNLSSSDIKRQSMKELFEVNGIADLYDACEKVMSEGQEVEMEFLINPNKDEPRSGLFLGTPVYDENGNIEGLQSVILDITQQKQIQAEKNAADALEMLQNGLALVSNELNNAMAPILLDSQMLEKRLSDEIDLKGVNRIQGSVHKARSALRPFLVTSQALGSRSETLDTRKIIQQTLDSVKADLPDNLRMEFHIAKDLDSIDGDASLLAKLLKTLIANGIESMTGKGILTISAKMELLDTTDQNVRTLHLNPGKHIHITVKDQGIGIAPHLTQRIFEPFYTTKEEPHKGMGLSEALGIVKSHRGNLKVLSKPQEGTAVHVYLPISEKITKEHPSKNPTNAPDQENNNRLILVVDDEENIVASTTTLLEANGYEVLSASNGAEALAIFDQKRAEISLIITDFKMPTMNGVDLIKSIRQISPSKKIILMTGMEDEDNLKDISQLEVNHTLFKPFSISTLSEAVNNVLNEPFSLD